MFFSFVVQSRETVDVPEHRLTIGEGLDTFNITITDLDRFKARLASLGVVVLQANQLDELEPLPPNLIEDYWDGNDGVREENPQLERSTGQDPSALP